jgi:RND family efflux transporter MFP subunit
MPRQRTFSDRIEAFGVAQGDPRQARSISLAQAGQVVALDVVVGQTVHAGDALLQLATDPAARNAYVQAQSALVLARSELTRTTQLAAQHLATASQLAAARKAVTDAQSALAAQRALGGGRTVATVRAPADGVVTTIPVALGDRVAANTALLGFTPSASLVAQLGVPPGQAARLKVGMPVTLHAVYGDPAPGEGQVRMLGRAIDPQSRLLPLQVSMPASLAAQLVAGAALDAQIHVASYTSWAVPRTALRHDDHGDYLFQLQHGKARRVDVQVRAPDGDTVGVDGPLDATQPVIVLGAYELDDGMAVREPAQ